MREIKFRAWCEGAHGGLTFINPTMEYDVIIQDGKYADVENGWDIHGTYETIPLMQYTGLKDKNGVEIYEGDILKTFSNINKYTDSFAEDIEPKFGYTTVVRDGACFKTTYKKRPSYVLNENGGSMVEHMEVIGNIYENPELLEREPQ